ncbi:hypothetical protein K457DRAFT_88736, partial [Linnemannia elongata AG-77]
KTPAIHLYLRTTESAHTQDHTDKHNNIFTHTHITHNTKLPTEHNIWRHHQRP